MEQFNSTFSDNKLFDVQFDDGDSEVEVNIGSVKFNTDFDLDEIDTTFISGDEHIFNIEFTSDSKKEVYEGIYTVTPSVKNELSLGTKEKVMKDDVTIKKVPLYRTSNVHGGTTVYIGRGIDNG